MGAGEGMLVSLTPPKPEITYEWMSAALEWSPWDQQDAAQGGDRRSDERATYLQWPWVMLAQRLAWHYGQAEAMRRLIAIRP